MPLETENGRINTSHASKQSKISIFKLFEVHTSAMVPLLLIPVFPFWGTVKFAVLSVLVLVLLERRGWTVSLALKRMRTRLASRVRYRNTRRTLMRRMKINDRGFDK